MINISNLEHRNPAVQHIVKFFEWEHLPTHLQAPSKAVATLVEELLEYVPENPELTAGLRKLLEAKDCFVRAYLPR